MKPYDYTSCSEVVDLTACITKAGYRWPVFHLFIYFPVVFFLIEFCMNRIEMTQQHVVYPAGALVGFIVMSIFGQFAYG